DRFRRGVPEAGNIVPYRALEELDVLRQIADMLSEIRAVPCIDVGAVETHRSRVWLPYADQHACKGRLACGARPDQTQRFPRSKIEAHPLQDQLVAARDGKHDSIDRQGAVRPR